MRDLDDVRSGVDARLADHLASLRAELSGLGPGCDELIDALERTVTGGKRVRAALCYASWHAHGGPSAVAADHDDVVLRVGAALELFQAAALVHDDVMDGSDTRRGRPAAHRAFEAAHRAAGWLGSPHRFGEAAAILLGDLALIASERESAAAVADVPEPARGAVHGLLALMRTEVTAGQYLDVRGQVVPWGVDPVADEAAARAVIRAKSARYSVEHPVVVGALLAGAGPGAVAAARAAALPLGEAFQLRDDLLGVFGDPATTGKPAGDDLREGKRTVLVARALAAADRADAALLMAHLGDPGLTGTQVEDLRALLVGTGAVASVEALIDELARPALALLASADLVEPGRSQLLTLAAALVDRSA